MLPKTKTKMKTNMSDYTTLLYGPSKSGKSTFCSEMDGALFLATEPGLNALETYQMPITSWRELLDALGEIEKGNHQFKTIVIDTIVNAYEFCIEYISHKELGGKHPSDASFKFGRGWAPVNREFKKKITKLAALPYGLFLIAHTSGMDVDAPAGKSFKKTTLNLSGKSRETVLGLVDVALLVQIIEVESKKKDEEIIEKRVLKTKPSKYYDAGDRTKYLPESIPFDCQTYTKEFKIAVKKKAEEDLAKQQHRKK